MRILFVGDLNEYGRSFQRYRTFIDLGHDVYGLSVMPIPWYPGINTPSFLERLMWKFSLPLDLTCVNQDIRNLINQQSFDIVWIEKGNTVTPKTLRLVKKILPDVKLASCSEDDMYASHNHSLYYRWGLHYYDIVFTTKPYNLSELSVLGAKKTMLFLDAYDERLHCPTKLTDEDKRRFSCDVGFIGTFEEDRAIKMLYLAEHGIPVTVWGNDWTSWMKRHPNLIVKGRPLYGEDYVKAINATKINLCFLRKLNRDETTSRSVEIPACGGFMVAERTERHLESFKEGEEAVFFRSKEELLELVRKYLNEEDQRKRIAEAGRERCIKNGYDHKTQLKNMLTYIAKLKP